MASLQEILAQLRLSSAILVTGPQRSGTTIAAHIIAHELGYTYVDEKAFGVHFPEDAKKYIDQGKVVVQAPALCHVAHTFGCAVVMMRRPLQDIHTSESRIHWPQRELRRELSKYGQRIGDSAEIKYNHWDSAQRGQCLGFDSDYHSLQTHALWVAQDKRKRFGKRQWKLDLNATTEPGPPETLTPEQTTPRHLDSIGNALGEFKPDNGSLNPSGSLCTALKPIYGFIHIATINHEIGRWQSICAEIQESLTASGLAAASDRIFQCNLGAHSCPPLFPNATVIDHGSNLRLYEYPTLQLLHDWCRQHDCYVYYLHSKGVSYPPNEKSDSWRTHMLKSITDWRKCIAALKEYDTTGPQWRRWRGYYSGNFWWARSNYIRCIEGIEQSVPDKKNRKLAERWVTSGAGKFHSM